MTVSSDRLNLADIAKTLEPDGAVAQVAEILNETNEMLQDMPFYPSNADFGNRITRRSSLPSVAFTRINQGVAKSKGTFEQRTDTIGIIEAASEVDSKIRASMGTEAFASERRLQDQGFEEAMAQTVAETLLYGDESTNDVAFTGLAPRLMTLSTSLSASRVVAAGSVSGNDGTSLYVADWDRRFVHGIYPKNAEDGMTAGLKVEDHGKQRVTDADGLPFWAYVTGYTFCIGLTVRDRRHIGRLANIDVSAIATAGASGYSGPDLLNKLTDLMAHMPPPMGAKRVMYCHNLVWAAIKKLAMAKSNAALSYEDFMGKGPTPFFDGYPIRRMDRISIAETDAA